jgi:hypothetical protein
MVKSKITFDNVYAKEGRATGLRHFATSVFDYLGFGQIEEHRSANYWGEEYFVAHHGNLSLTVALTDEKGFGDYTYWISLKGPESVDAAERSRIGDELARRLTIGGFEVARPYSMDDWLYAHPIVKRVVYHKKLGNAGIDPQVETILEEIRVAI